MWLILLVYGGVCFDSCAWHWLSFANLFFYTKFALLWLVSSQQRQNNNIWPFKHNQGFRCRCHRLEVKNCDAIRIKTNTTIKEQTYKWALNIHYIFASVLCSKQNQTQYYECFFGPSSISCHCEFPESRHSNMEKGSWRQHTKNKIVSNINRINFVPCDRA